MAGAARVHKAVIIRKGKVLMKTIFEQGSLQQYASVRLDEARSIIRKPESFAGRASETTVFISHKHDELDDLKGLLGFLQKKYGVKVYIDSQDTAMPKVTSMVTASRIKERIKQCNKFIFMATNGAIESKWCNWELGYGDALKYKNNIALFSMKPQDSNDSSYKGHEYMNIYPHISYFDGTEKYSNGNPIAAGYYVRSCDNDGIHITPLKKWFEER